jgi:hypothetical protein
MSKTKKIFLASVAALVLLIVGAIGYHLWLQSGALFRLETFDRDKWLSGGKIRDPTACLPGASMAHDIMTRVIQKGMSRQEVVALLGGPDPGEVKKIGYALGMCIGLEEQGIDIYFDDTGKVTHVEIR